MLTSCFYTDNVLVNHIWNNHNNYKIEYSKKDDYSCCAVYFSSNGIYFPNDELTFEKEIIIKDKYEWYKTRIHRAAKHIFVRDVHKEWYLSGLNKNICNLKQMKEWLYKEILGYEETIFIGSSAGAYCAMLMGFWLKATFVFAFSPQINLDIERFSGKDLFPYLHMFSKTNNYHLFNLKNVITNGSNICWFYPCFSKEDIPHYREGVKIPFINLIAVQSPCHGVFLSKPALNNVLNMTESSLISLYGKVYSYFGINLRLGRVNYLKYFFTSRTEIKRVIKSFILCLLRK